MIPANVHVAWRVACSLAFLSQGVVAVIRGNKLGAGNNKQVKHSQRGTVLIPLRTTMSSIDMLEIAGIRSFAPEPPQVYSPFDCGSCVECRLDARVTRKPLCFKLPAQIFADHQVLQAAHRHRGGQWRWENGTLHFSMCFFVVLPSGCP
jgi:hypothetical protein